MLKQTIVLGCAIFFSAVTGAIACEHTNYIESTNTITQTYHIISEGDIVHCGETKPITWSFTGQYPSEISDITEKNSFQWFCGDTFSRTGNGCYDGGKHRGYGNGYVRVTHLSDLITFTFYYKKCRDCNQLLDYSIDEDKTHQEHNENIIACTKAG